MKPRRIAPPNPIVRLAWAGLRKEQGTKEPAAGGAAKPAARPKEEPAKPGKGGATKDEQAWMDAIMRYGCVACRHDGVPPRPTAVHHLLRGGRRMGHKHSIGLCDPGHHQGGKPLGMVSRHPDKAKFEATYGTEKQLLAGLRRILKKQRDGSYAP